MTKAKAKLTTPHTPLYDTSRNLSTTALPEKVEADRGEDLGVLHRSLPLWEYLHALSEGKKAKAAKIAENGGGTGGGSDSKKKRNKSKKAEVRQSCHRSGGKEDCKKEGRGGEGSLFVRLTCVCPRPFQDTSKALAAS